MPCRWGWLLRWPNRYAPRSTDVDAGERQLTRYCTAIDTKIAAHFDTGGYQNACARGPNGAFSML